MYYRKKGVSVVGTRKLVTISLPPRLLKQAEQVAAQENRTRSELVREALRLYLDTSEARRRTTREQLLTLIDRVQDRTRGVASVEIRKLVQEAVEAARRPRQRART